jgi:hypothetical protein
LGLKDNLVIIITGIRPTEWIGPSRSFLTACDIVLSAYNDIIKFSEIGTNTPEDSDLVSWSLIVAF